MKNTMLQIHKPGSKVINVPRVTQRLIDQVNACAIAERKTQRDWCIDALEQAIKDCPLRLGIQRIDRKLNEGVTSRPDEAAALAADDDGKGVPA